MVARVYEQMGGAKGMMTAAWKEAFELTRDRAFVRAERARRAERRRARAMEAWLEGRDPPPPSSGADTSDAEAGHGGARSKLSAAEHD